MKSEIFVKSMAALEKEIAEQDVNCEDKSLSEILDDNKELRPDGVPRSDSSDNGKSEEKV